MDFAFIKKKAVFLYEREGFLGPVRALGRKTYHYGIQIPGNFFSYFWTAVIQKKQLQTFDFQGRKYNYLVSYRNFAWLSERTAEVPIVAAYVAEAERQGKRVLEVGDVLRQYTGLNKQEIVDKYEYRKGIVNVDIEEFLPRGQYDLIISISTMEHVGWNPPDALDPEKSARAMRIFRDRFLAPGGMGVITLPVGYNPEIDKRLRSNELPFAKTYFLKRISKNNDWVETTEADALTKKYGAPFPDANAIVVGIIQASNESKTPK